MARDKSKKVAKAAEPDSTLFGTPPATIRLLFLLHADVPWMSMSQLSDLLSPRKKPFNHCHCPKQQSRVVFKVCVALHHVSKLGNAMTVLLSCLFDEILCSHCAFAQVLIGGTALQLMFLAG